MRPKTTTDDWVREVGSGWEKLVRPLVERCEREGVQIAQIKEKFGGLRFYVHNGDDALYEDIDKAEAESFKLCEECGEPGKRHTHHGWLKTLCDTHAKAREARRP